MRLLLVCFRTNGPIHRVYLASQQLAISAKCKTRYVLHFSISPGKIYLIHSTRTATNQILPRTSSVQTSPPERRLKRFVGDVDRGRGLRTESMYVGLCHPRRNIRQLWHSSDKFELWAICSLTNIGIERRNNIWFVSDSIFRSP